jgi:acyl carrier protein
VTKTEIKTQLKAFICAEVIGDPDYRLGDDEPLISGGLIDSFALAHIAVFIEETFRVYIPDVELTGEDFDTVEQIATRVGMG